MAARAPRISGRGRRGAVLVKPDPRYKLDKWKDHLEERWGHFVSYSDVIDFLADMIGPPEKLKNPVYGEFVTFDPDDPETYPSVCATPDDVKDRFGFTGGEKLLFTSEGDYVGEVVKEVGKGN